MQLGPLSGKRVACGQRVAKVNPRYSTCSTTKPRFKTQAARIPQHLTDASLLDIALIRPPKPVSPPESASLDRCHLTPAREKPTNSLRRMKFMLLPFLNKWIRGETRCELASERRTQGQRPKSWDESAPSALRLVPNARTRDRIHTLWFPYQATCLRHKPRWKSNSCSFLLSTQSSLQFGSTQQGAFCSSCLLHTCCSK